MALRDFYENAQAVNRRIVEANALYHLGQRHQARDMLLDAERYMDEFFQQFYISRDFIFDDRPAHPLAAQLYDTLGIFRPHYEKIERAYLEIDIR